MDADTRSLNNILYNWTTVGGKSNLRLDLRAYPSLLPILIQSTMDGRSNSF